VIRGDGLLVDGEKLSPTGQSGVVQSALVIGHDDFVVGGWNPVDDEDDGERTLPGPFEELPWDRVGVSLGAGHEDAEVGDSQQVVGHLPVLVDHRVEVGRIDHRHALQEGIRRRSHVQLARFSRSVARQEGPGVPTGLAGVGPHHRTPRGRPDGTRGRDGVLGEGIDQGRLAAPG
jgi:hypothetical protein